MSFQDRRDAGQQLAAVLKEYSDKDAVVLGLPRGGIPVAFDVAMALSLPLDVVLVRKLGAPSQPELAVGAIGEDGTRFVDPEIVSTLWLSDADVQAIEDRERVTLTGRARAIRSVIPRITLASRIAIVIDDGAATGSTMRTACQVVRGLGARAIVVALPVAAASALALLAGAANEIVCLEAPGVFFAVGQAYEDFRQVSDDEVLTLLRACRERDLLAS